MKSEDYRSGYEDATNAAVTECQKWLARRRETMREIFGTDSPGTYPNEYGDVVEHAKADGEVYAYESLARAIRASSPPQP